MSMLFDKLRKRKMKNTIRNEQREWLVEEKPTVIRCSCGKTLAEIFKGVINDTLHDKKHVYFEIVLYTTRMRASPTGHLDFICPRDRRYNGFNLK